MDTHSRISISGGAFKHSFMYSLVTTALLLNARPHCAMEWAMGHLEKPDRVYGGRTAASGNRAHMVDRLSRAGQLLLGFASALLANIGEHPWAGFLIFATAHAAIWTNLPFTLYPNLPLDIIEALTYGHEWQLGYDKLPPLSWWLVEIAYRTFNSAFAYYALG